MTATAVVVGSGPNGLAGAIHLAGAGVRVTVLEAATTAGGGMRSSERTLPGLVHDECSAFHPTALASPFLASLDLARHGLRWRWPDWQFAHPFDDGSAGLAHRSLDLTADRLGHDGDRWRQVFGPLVESYDDLAADVLRPLLHVPRHPVSLARLGLRAVAPASLLARRWRGETARGLFGGVAAHLIAPLTAPLSSAVGVMLTAAAHRHGWPVAEGGSAALARALVAELEARGGTVETGVEVTSTADFADADIVLLDVSPPAAAKLLGERLPRRVRRRYERYRFGPGAFKLDLAVEGGIPWRAAEVGGAGTVHLGGSFDEIRKAEAEVAAGRMPGRPFVLVGQQSVADPSRSVGDLHPVWAYAHVPAGWSGDASAAIIDQIERFAPGTRQRIVATASRSAPEFAAYNANYVGGDILCGSNAGASAVMRPGWAAAPYRTGVDGVFLCSAATPPGPGVHGLGGYFSAVAALAAAGIG